MKNFPRLALLIASFSLPSLVPAALRAADPGSPITAAAPGNLSEIDRLKVELSTAQVQLAQSQDQLQKLNQQLGNSADASKQLQMAQAALDSKDREIAGLKAAAAAAPTPSLPRTAESGPPAAANEVSLAQAQAAAAKAAADTVAQLQQANAALAAAQQGLADRPTADALKALATERDALKLQVAEQQATLAQLDSRVAAQAATPPPAATETGAADLQKKLNETQEKLDAALSTFNQQNGKIDQLTKTVADIDNERGATVEKLKATQAELDAANKTAADRAADLARAQTEFAAQRAIMAPSAEQVAILREQLRLAQEAAIEKAAANQSLTADNQALTARLAASAAAPAMGPAVVVTTPIPAPETAPSAATIAPPATPAAPAGPQHHVVVAGDSLSKISLKYYGTATRWNEIFEANRNVMKDANALKVGAELLIP